MTSLIWDDTYNTGDVALDIQHRKIFDLMTSIYNELSDSRQKCDLFDGMFDQLEILCQMHFMDEERLMEEMNYPLAEGHKRLHNILLVNIDRFKINNQCHSADTIHDFINIREDFITHTLNENILLGDFIKTVTTGNSLSTAS